MDVKDQTSQLHQLLLTPLHLLLDIQGVMIPGISFLLLLAFKGNSTIQAIWWHSPFGYKTKVALFLLLSYVVGKLIFLPFSIFLSLMALIRKVAKQPSPQAEPVVWSHLPKEQRDLVTGVVTLGPLLATPGLMDRLAVMQVFNFLLDVRCSHIVRGGFYLHLAKGISRAFRGGLDMAKLVVGGTNWATLL
jgi:hypothetical protein